MSVKISAADVKKLRDMTGAGMMDCKKALNESEGDFEKAIEILRKKGENFLLNVQIGTQQKESFWLWFLTIKLKG